MKDEGVCAKVTFAIQNQRYLWNEAVYSQSYYRVYGLSIGHKSGDLAWMNFGLRFREHNFHTTDISHTFCRNATKFGNLGELANRNLFPEFRELWSGDSVIPCGDIHQSFTGTLVKSGFSTPSQCLPIVSVFFLFTALPED